MVRGSSGRSANSFCELRAEELRCFVSVVVFVLRKLIGHGFHVILRRLFRGKRPLFAVGVLAPDEALRREAGVKQSGITVIFIVPAFSVMENVGFLFFRGYCSEK